MAEFQDLTGLEPQTRERRREFGAITLKGIEGAPQIPSGGSHKLRLKSVRAEVLGHEEDGSPALSVASYGRGKVFYLNTPLELTVTRTPGILHTPGPPPCWAVYRHIAGEVMEHRAIRKQHPMVGVTEHPRDDGSRVIVAVNYSPEKINEALTPRSGWKLSAILYGKVEANGECALPGNDAVVFLVKPE